jgi:hypothetical protein
LFKTIKFSLTYVNDILLIEFKLMWNGLNCIWICLWHFHVKRSFNVTWAIQNSPKKNPTFCLIAFETLATPHGIASYIYKGIIQSIRLDYSPIKASRGLWSISKKKWNIIYLLTILNEIKFVKSIWDLRQLENFENRNYWIFLKFH